MTMRHWPLFGLRLSTPRLELCLHDPAVMPFGVPWTDAEPPARARATVQYHWGKWATWQPQDWALLLVAVADGTVVGMQELDARDFALVREVSTGSWLGLRHQGQGLGTQMRAAVLHLAFAELGAEFATSKAFLDNPASLGVSRKLGYQPDGLVRHEIRGRAATQQRLRLSRTDWELHRTVPVEVYGLEACLPLLGIG